MLRHRRRGRRAYAPTVSNTASHFYHEKGDSRVSMRRGLPSSANNPGIEYDG